MAESEIKVHVEIDLRVELDCAFYMPVGELVSDFEEHDFVALIELWRDCGIPLEQGEEWETTILQAFPDLLHGLNLVKWKDAK